MVRYNEKKPDMILLKNIMMKTINNTHSNIKAVVKFMYGLALLLLISCGNDDDTASVIPVETPTASSLQIVSGNNQIAFINETLADVIEIQVNDQNGNAFPGTTISLSVDEGTISSNTLVTNASGRATVSWILGETIGEQILTMTAFGSDGMALVGSPASIMAEALDLCQTFISTEQLPIGPDAGTETISVITITDEFLLTDETIVTLNLEHTFDADLDIFLIAPNGLILVLSTDNGGAGNNYTNTIFDDQGSALVTNGIAPFTGTFRPQDSLALLAGVQALGDWTLFIVDDQNIDEGILLDWSIQLCRP